VGIGSALDRREALLMIAAAGGSAMASAAIASPRNPPSAQLPAVGEAVTRTLTGVVSGTVLVAQKGRVLWAGGIGNPAAGAPAPRRESVFDTLSIGKTFTAIALQKLASQGKVQLSAPIRRYLPELPTDFEDITLQHAMDNNSGWGVLLDGGDFDPRSPVDLIRDLAATKRERKAGTGYAYSNIGFQALGLVVMRAAGMPFETAMRRLVFEPAHLPSTGFFSEPRWRKTDVVQGYVDGKRVGSPTTWPNTWSLLGAAGIASTADDLYRLNRTFLAGEGLGPAGRARMLAEGAHSRGGPYKDADTLGINYGSGLYHWHDRKGRHVHFHGGAGDFGFSDMMWWRQEDDLFIVGLFNSLVEQPEDKGATTNDVRGRLVAAVSQPLDAD
jgi:CubicO group peptidase (beta-lactamase class C family)